MKSLAQLSQQLARQWRNADLRERRLLQGREGWPLELHIGAPDSSTFADMTTALRQHIDEWRSVTARGPGRVLWESRKFRAGATAVDLPIKWVLDKSSDWLAAADDPQMRAEYAFLQATLGEVDPQFRSLLVRRLTLVQHLSAQEVIAAASVAMQLTPGCAEGKPLRALSVSGNDSKFFERHEALIKALLDVRFDGEATRQGLHAFLGARRESEHWLLVVPLEAGLLPFARMRLAASDLLRMPLPATRILVVENEQALHLLPRHLPQTIAILGAGLDLEWLAAPWLATRQVAYWGDMDTWGMFMLGRARKHLPSLHALLMDRATFDAHSRQAVSEAVHAPCAPPELQAGEQTFFEFLQAHATGRVEQEFVNAEYVSAALAAWCELTQIAAR